MERKRLIRPITVEKVKQFLREVLQNVSDSETFSLDKLAREHSISGSNSTAIIRLGWLLETDVKFQYAFNPEKEFYCDDKYAKILIEEVRLHTGKVASGESVAKTTRNVSTTESKSKDDNDFSLPKKTLISPEIASVLNKVETALQILAQKEQRDLFGGINDVHAERVRVASAIATGIYSSVLFHHQSDANDRLIVEGTNELIIFATNNLMDKIINYKDFK